MSASLLIFGLVATNSGLPRAVQCDRAWLLRIRHRLDRPVRVRLCGERPLITPPRGRPRWRLAGRSRGVRCRCASVCFAQTRMGKPIRCMVAAARWRSGSHKRMPPIRLMRPLPDQMEPRAAPSPRIPAPARTQVSTIAARQSRYSPSPGRDGQAPALERAKPCRSHHRVGSASAATWVWRVAGALAFRSGGEPWFSVNPGFCPCS